MARILVVDDSAVSQLILTHILLEAEHEVIPAANGREAHALLAAQDADLLISDIYMPEMDGIELLTQLRSEERFSRLPVILLTGSADDERLLQQQFDVNEPMLKKPVSSWELLALAEQLLESS